jgi:capsular polysaccharide transport system permease protein
VFDRFWHMLTYLLFPLSGAMFLADWLPASARVALLWLPMVHGVEMLRGGWFGPVVVTHGSALYLMGATLAVAWCALVLLRHHGRHIEVPG